MKLFQVTASLCVVALVLAGCTLPAPVEDVQVSRELSSASGEQPVASWILAHAPEGNFAACVGRGITNAQPNVRVVDVDQFDRLAFPGVEEGEKSKALVIDASVRERIAPLDLHYLVAVGGAHTAEGPGEGWGSCGASGALVLCFGPRRWNKESGLSATVLALKESASLGTLRAKASGTKSAWAAFLIGGESEPDTEGSACEELGRAVAELIAEKRLDSTFPVSAVMVDARLFDAGDAETLYRLGWENPNRESKLYWYCVAASQGHLMAQYELGNYYRLGYASIEEKLVKAYLWYSLAIGFEAAARWKERVAAAMTPEQIAEAERLVEGWQPDAASCE